MNNLYSRTSPDWVSPPGETILDIIEDKGWSQVELSKRLGYTEKHVSQLITGKASITNDTASKLANTLGSTEGFWLKREAIYRERVATLESMKKCKEWVSWLDIIPVKELMQAGAITKQMIIEKNKPNIVFDCLRFFSIASPKEWTTNYANLQVSFKRSREDQSDVGAITSWLRLGEREIESSPKLTKYNKDKLISELPNIRALAGNDLDDFGNKLIKILNSCGVAIIFVRSIPRAHVSGVARWITSNQPVIQMSLYGKSHDKFWFTLFHEIAHIILHANTKEDKKAVFLDDPMNSKSLDPKEIEADKWASDMLIPSEELKYLPSLKSKKSVLEFSEKIKIHPGIVVGRLQHDGLIEPSWMNDLKVKIDFV